MKEELDDIAKSINSLVRLAEMHLAYRLNMALPLHRTALREDTSHESFGAGTVGRASPRIFVPACETF